MTTENGMDGLEARIGRLEKSARRWRVSALSLGFVVVAGVSMGQIVIRGGGAGGGGINSPQVTTDRLVVSKAIVLKDAKGGERLVISTEADTALVSVRNEDDKLLFSLTADEEAAKLLIQDAKGKKLFAAP